MKRAEEHFISKDQVEFIWMDEKRTSSFFFEIYVHVDIISIHMSVFFFVYKQSNRNEASF